tara:strand:- start:552 stop:2525 length:1974 start_codon:yes stop_codon:yes gene_type:complete
MKDSSSKVKNKTLNESIDFKLIFKYLFSKKNLFLLIFVICFTGLGFIYKIHKDKNLMYQGSFKLLIEDPIKSRNNTLMNSEGGQSSVFSGVTTSSDLFTLSSFLRSELVLSDLAKKYNINVADLIGKIGIQRGGPAGNANGVLIVNLKSSDKLLGKKLINELAKTYVESARRYRERKLGEGLVFINKTKPEFEKELKILDKKFRYFEEKYVLIEDKPVAGAVQEYGLTNVVSKTDQIQNKLNFISNQNIEIKNILNRNPKKINSQKIIDFIKVYRLTEKSSVNSNLEKTNFEELKLLISKKIDKNNNYINYLQKQIDEINLEFANPELLTRTISQLMQDIKKVKKAIQRLEGASEDYKLQLAQNSTPWNIIGGPSMSEEPISKPLLNLVLQFCTFSGLIALTIITILILLEDKFVENNQIEDFSGIKIIGNIPKINSYFLEELKSYKFLDVSFKEKYKSIPKIVSFEKSFYDFCMFIKSFKSKNDSNIFLITSTFTSDINQNLSFYIAKLFSTLKEKTLLINANFDSSEIKLFTKTSSKQGLLKYLSDEKVPIENIIYNSGINENLDFISLGEATKNEGLLILSKKMEDLLKKLKQEYSYIFINSQDLNNTETIAISKFSDKTILIFDKNQITKSEFSNLLSKLQNKVESTSILISE